MSNTTTYDCITETAIQNFKPTYLYIKRHSVTGLLYFGKTVHKDPTKYLGSGKHWVNNYRKHGKEFIETIWFRLFDDIYDLVEFAIFFSENFDIVKSKRWANLMIENGLDGGGAKGRIVSLKTRQLLSKANKGQIPWSKGKPCPEDKKKKISKSNSGKTRTEEECNYIALKTKEAMQKPEVKSRCSEPHRRDWLLISPEGIEFRTRYLREFCEDKKINHGKMKQLANGRQKFKSGWNCFWDDIKSLSS